MHSQLEPEPPAILQVWGLAEPARRGPQAKLTLAEVVAAALAVADEEGAAAVTLATVARRLGITTTGLYRYVDSKDTLDELAADAALGPAPSLTDDPHAQVSAWVDALWERYSAHPWLAGRAPSRAPRCPHAYAWLAALVAPLAALGEPRPMPLAVTLDTLVRGYAQQAQVAPRDTVSGQLAAELARRHPGLAEAAASGIDPRADLREAIRRLLPT